MITKRLAELGYDFQPAALEVRGIFHSAVRVGDLVFTSGQLPSLGTVQIKGKVGADVDLATAQKAAEICAFNCIRAVGAVADIESIERVVKIFGMVNVADGFSDTSTVINGCTEFLTKLLGESGYHARSAVGMALPANWAVEIEMVAQVV